MNVKRISGEKPGGFFSPFHEAGMIAVKAIFYPCFQGFSFILQPVQVNMEYLFYFSFFFKEIFIDDRKSRTPYGILYFLNVAKGMDKRCFTGTHRSIKSDHSGIPGQLPEPGCYFVYGIQ